MNKKTEAEGAVSECSALLGGALGDVIAQYRDGDMSACADALLKIVWEFRELERDAARYRFLRDEDNWGDDSGDDCWERLGESHAGAFDEIVDSRMSKATVPHNVEVQGPARSDGPAGADC